MSDSCADDVDVQEVKRGWRHQIVKSDTGDKSSEGHETLKVEVIHWRVRYAESSARSLASVMTTAVATVCGKKFVHVDLISSIRIASGAPRGERHMSLERWRQNALSDVRTRLSAVRDHTNRFNEIK